MNNLRLFTDCHDVNLCDIWIVLSVFGGVHAKRDDIQEILFVPCPKVDKMERKKKDEDGTKTFRIMHYVLFGMDKHDRFIVFWSWPHEKYAWHRDNLHNYKDMEIVRGSCKNGSRGCEVDKDLPYGVTELKVVAKNEVKRATGLRKAA